MFEPQFEIEIYKLHKRVAYRSNEKDLELSFQILNEFSSYHLMSKSNDEFTMALC
jgi:uncharacterized protein YktA (UPF0223 family)